jgi:hypothetical protein
MTTMLELLLEHLTTVEEGSKQMEVGQALYSGDPARTVTFNVKLPSRKKTSCLQELSSKCMSQVRPLIVEAHAVLVSLGKISELHAQTRGLHKLYEMSLTDMSGTKQLILRFSLSFCAAYASRI